MEDESQKKRKSTTARKLSFSDDDDSKKAGWSVRIRPAANKKKKAINSAENSKKRKSLRNSPGWSVKIKRGRKRIDFESPDHQDSSSDTTTDNTITRTVSAPTNPFFTPRQFNSEEISVLNNLSGSNIKALAMIREDPVEMVTRHAIAQACDDSELINEDQLFRPHTSNNAINKFGSLCKVLKKSIINFNPLKADGSRLDDDILATRWNEYKNYFLRSIEWNRIDCPVLKYNLLLHVGGPEITSDVCNQRTAEKELPYTAWRTAVDAGVQIENPIFTNALERLDETYAASRRDNTKQRLLLFEMKQGSKCFDAWVRELDIQAGWAKLSGEQRIRDLKLVIGSNARLHEVRKEALKDCSTLLTIKKVASTEERSESIEAFDKKKPKEVLTVEQWKGPNNSIKARSSGQFSSSPLSGDKSCFNCGFGDCSGGQRCPARGVKCHNCGKLNHYAKVCRSGNQHNSNNLRQSENQGRNFGNFKNYQRNFGPRAKTSINKVGTEEIRRIVREVMNTDKADNAQKV